MAKHRGQDGEVLSWERCRAAFHVDGSWRDLYVFETDLGDWDRFLDLVRSSEWESSFVADASFQPLPDSSAEIFEDKERSKNLSIDLGAVVLNCHFFTPEEIELDADPREIQSQDAMDRVLSFMLRLGRCLKKQVLLTEENAPGGGWFRYEPISDSLTLLKT